jgi:hypothetical protein
MSLMQRISLLANPPPAALTTTTFFQSASQKVESKGENGSAPVTTVANQVG